MQTAKLPDSICNSLDKLNIDFFGEIVMEERKSTQLIGMLFATQSSLVA